MTDHLPECAAGVSGSGLDCICDRLRACEQRKDVEWFHEMRKHGRFAKGYATGVQAARDAVEVTLLGTLQLTRDRVLAAIDALKGE